MCSTAPPVLPGHDLDIRLIPTIEMVVWPPGNHIKASQLKSELGENPSSRINIELRFF